MSTRDAVIFEFGPFRLDPGSRTLSRDGRRVHLTARMFDLLVYLVQNAGRQVRKDELLDAVWSDNPVEESNLPVTVSALRKVLGEQRHEHRFLVTVPRYGYRFTPDVAWRPRDAGVEPAPLTTLAPGSARVTPSATLVLVPFRTPGNAGACTFIDVGLTNAVLAALSGRARLVFKAGPDDARNATDLEGVRQLGRKYSAHAVVSGTVFVQGPRLRVAVELVRVRDSAVLWAERFDETVGDPFGVEDVLGQRIADALHAKLSGDDPRRGAEGASHIASARQAYLKGRYFWERRTESSLRQGITCFEEAVALDATYAAAQLGIADCYFLLSYYGAIPPGQGYPKVTAAAEGALAIDPTLGVAHTSLGCVRLFYDWDGPGALKAFERALALHPDHARTHHWYSEYLRVTGRFDEALSAMERARSLEPLSLMVTTSLGLVLFYARRYDDAQAQVRKALELDPYFGVAHWVLGLVLEQQHQYDAAVTEFRKALGLSGKSTLMMATLAHACAKARQRAEARRILDNLTRLSARRYVSPYVMAVVHTGLDQHERAFDWLGKALAERTSWLCYAAVNPILDPLRGDARFVRLVRSVGLALPA